MTKVAGRRSVPTLDHLLRSAWALTGWDWIGKLHARYRGDAC